MKFVICFLAGVFAITSCKAQEDESSKILIFSKTEGFRHSSIAKGAKAITEIAEELKLKALHTEDAAVFNADSLQYYTVVVFLNTTGDILNQEQEQAFENFISNGGGFVGIHSATDTEYEWTWFGRMVGGYFNGHPKIQEAMLHKVAEHEIMSGIPEEWRHKDEWYNFRDMNSDVMVLQNLDESTYEGGNMGENHPITWYHEFEGGKIFYTGLGHREETYDDQNFRRLIKNGLSVVSKK